MATARPQRRELPAAARGRTSELLYGSLLSPLTREASRRGSLRRGHAVDSKHWQPLTWKHLPWLRSLTKLPLILKGICHPDDARRAIDAGIEGIYCSNHGGRQANGGVPAIDMLPGIVEACGRTPVLFDSGVRSGSDVVKALAMGATAVGIGRPYVYGLALAGTEGVTHVLRSFLAEADLLMAIDGFPTLTALRQAGVVRL
jgi:lactate 2-monooxygenase